MNDAIFEANSTRIRKSQATTDVTPKKLICAIRGQNWSPHMSFILKGSQILALEMRGWFKSKNIETKYKTHIKRVHEIYGTCFQYNVTS